MTWWASLCLILANKIWCLQSYLFLDWAQTQAAQRYKGFWGRELVHACSDVTFLPIGLWRRIFYQSPKNAINSSLTFVVQVKRIAKIFQWDWEKFVFFVVAVFVLKAVLSKSSEFFLNETVPKAISCHGKGRKNRWVDIWFVTFKEGSSFQKIQIKVLYLKKKKREYLPWN